jgi:hypothetical protein
VETDANIVAVQYIGSQQKLIVADVPETKFALFLVYDILKRYVYERTGEFRIAERQRFTGNLKSVSSFG